MNPFKESMYVQSSILAVIPSTCELEICVSNSNTCISQFLAVDLFIDSPIPRVSAWTRHLKQYIHVNICRYAYECHSCYFHNAVVVISTMFPCLMNELTVINSSVSYLCLHKLKYKQTERSIFIFLVSESYPLKPRMCNISVGVITH